MVYMDRDDDHRLSPLCLLSHIGVSTLSSDVSTRTITFVCLPRTDRERLYVARLSGARATLFTFWVKWCFLS